MDITSSLSIDNGLLFLYNLGFYLIYTYASLCLIKAIMISTLNAFCSFTSRYLIKDIENLIMRLIMRCPSAGAAYIKTDLATRKALERAYFLRELAHSTAHLKNIKLREACAHYRARECATAFLADLDRWVGTQHGKDVRAVIGRIRDIVGTEPIPDHTLH